MSKDKFVSGPINVVRLEGKVNNIKKVLYIFMDIHVDVSRQSQCENIRSDELRSFIVNGLDKLKKECPDKIYDIFFEKSIVYPHFVDIDVKGRYLDEMSSLFAKAYKIDIEKGKVLESAELPNARLHYVDMRDLFTAKYGDMDIHEILTNNLQYLYHQYNFDHQIVSKLVLLKDGFNLLRSHLTYIYNGFYGKINKNNTKPEVFIYSKYYNVLSEYSAEEFGETRNYLIDKLLHKYKNEDIKKKIIHIIDGEFKEICITMLKKIDEIITKLSKYISDFEKFGNVDDIGMVLTKHADEYYYGIAPNVQKEFRDSLMRYDDLLFDIKYGSKFGIYLMDIYFLRRFLDKDYITNAMVYTGAAHSLNYIRYLVKDFSFKITNASYIKYNIKEVEHIIRNSKSLKDINELFYPEYLVQCSNLKDFPDLILE